MFRDRGLEHLRLHPQELAHERCILLDGTGHDVPASPGPQQEPCRLRILLPHLGVRVR